MKNLSDNDHVFNAAEQIIDGYFTKQTSVRESIAAYQLANGVRFTDKEKMIIYYAVMQAVHDAVKQIEETD